jgi:hypothetical protein
MTRLSLVEYRVRRHVTPRASKGTNPPNWESPGSVAERSGDTGPGQQSTARFGPFRYAPWRRSPWG